MVIFQVVFSILELLCLMSNAFIISHPFKYIVNLKFCDQLINNNVQLFTCNIKTKMELYLAEIFNSVFSF